MNQWLEVGLEQGVEGETVFGETSLENVGCEVLESRAGSAGGVKCEDVDVEEMGEDYAEYFVGKVEEEEGHFGLRVDEM